MKSNVLLEKAANFGCSILNDLELLTIIIGNKEKAEKLIGYNDNLFYTLNADIQVVSGLAHLTKTQVIRLMACNELSKRFNTVRDMEALKDSSSVSAFLMPLLRYEPTEKFIVLALNSKNELVSKAIISSGSICGAIVHPREVFRAAIASNAAAVIVAHNHPSGNPYPSKEDEIITKVLVESGEIIKIPVLDHIIIGNGTYFSFADAGKLNINAA